MTERFRADRRAGAALLLLFLHMTLLELTDSAMYQSGRRVAELVRQAYHKTQSKQAKAPVPYRERCLSIKAIVDDETRPAQERLAEIKELVADIAGKPRTSHATHHGLLF